MLDPRERHDFARLGDLADTVRIKRGGAYKHLKACEIDGATLRSGSANFNTSGEDAQENGLVLVRDGGGSADQFEARRVARSVADDRVRSTINALEPP